MIAASIAHQTRGLHSGHMNTENASAEPAAETAHLRGIKALHAGRLDEAEACLRQALALAPDNAVYQSNFSVILRERGLPEASLAAAERAVSLAPGFAGAWYNRGISLAELERYEEALQSYAQALTLNGDYAEAWFNQGSVLLRLDRLGEARDSYARAVALAPDNALFLHHLGVALDGLGLFADALPVYEKALELAPGQAISWFNCGIDRIKLGDLEGGKACYARALAGGHPDPELVRFFVAAAEGGSPPPTAPAEYLRNLFDGYAPRFEQHLVGVLGYAAPEVLFELLGAQLGRDLEILDLGCGTGLLGRRLRPHARRLIGVDLAPVMIEEARTREIYDALVLADVRDYLRARADPLDLVVATDVFIYVGDLDEIFSQVSRVLRPGGLFAFSVEQFDGEGFALLLSARFGHSYAYCTRLGRRHGLQLRKAESRPIRRHGEGEIAGYYLVFAKPA